MSDKVELLKDETEVRQLFITMLAVLRNEGLVSAPEPAVYTVSMAEHDAQGERNHYRDKKSELEQQRVVAGHELRAADLANDLLDIAENRPTRARTPEGEKAKSERDSLKKRVEELEQRLAEADILGPEDSAAFRKMLEAPESVLPGLAESLRARRGQPATEAAQVEQALPCGHESRLQCNQDCGSTQVGPTSARSCDCARCWKQPIGRYMVVCRKCGNKRCPKANDHDHACTGSNEPGQPGSAYAEQPVATEAAQVEQVAEAAEAAQWFASLSNEARELTRWIGTAIAAARAAGHDMVHGEAELDGVKGAGFFLVCTRPESASKAQALLVDALPLCTTDLGKGYCTDQPSPSPQVAQASAAPWLMVAGWRLNATYNREDVT